MLCLSRKTEYALVALGHLAAHRGTVVSAHQVANLHDLPEAMLMNILKRLNGKGLLRSIRGKNGGYQIAVDLAAVSLYDLIEHVEGRVEAGCDHDEPDAPRGARKPLEQAPIQALYGRIMDFLKAVRLSELVIPGRRIDVAMEGVRVRRRVPLTFRSPELIPIPAMI